MKTISVTEKTGELISILNVTNEEDLMIINKSGITIRTGVEELRVMGRATQGVRLISLRGNDQIASVCRVPKSEEEDEEGLDEGADGAVQDASDENQTPPETTEE